jgi:hypothetical protein
MLNRRSKEPEGLVGIEKYMGVDIFIHSFPGHGGSASHRKYIIGHGVDSQGFDSVKKCRGHIKEARRLEEAQIDQECVENVVKRL